MKYLKTYNNINEGLRDKMVGKSDEELVKNLKGEHRHVKLEKGIEYGIFELVKMAVDEGADINTFPAYIRDAVKTGNLELVKFLLDKNIKIWEVVAPHPTTIAIRNKDTDMLELLKKYDIKLKSGTELYKIIMHLVSNEENIEFIRYLKDNYDFVDSYIKFEIKQLEDQIKKWEKV